MSEGIFIFFSGIIATALGIISKIIIACFLKI